MRSAMRVLGSVVAVVLALATAGVAMARLSPTPSGTSAADAEALNALEDIGAGAPATPGTDAAPPGCTRAWASSWAARSAAESVRLHTSSRWLADSSWRRGMEVITSAISALSVTGWKRPPP